MRSGIQILALSLSTAAVLAAQPSSPIGVPLVGLTMDQSFQLRPIVGVPGAATLGAATKVDASMEVLAIGPHQDYVVALQGDAGDLVLVQRPLADAAVTVLTAGFGTGRVRVSPKGAALVAWGPAGAAQIWTGLPDHAALSWTADLSTISAASSFAVSDDGQAVLAAAAASDAVSIFVANAGNGARVLSSASQLGGLAFLAGTQDAVIGDAGSNQIYLIRDAGGAATVSMLGDASAGVASPADVASAEDARTVFVANASPGGVVMLDVNGGAPQSVACDCAPSGLARLSRSEVFRLTDSAAGLFWIFSATGVTPRITAVPPDPAQPAAQTGVQQ